MNLRTIIYRSFFRLAFEAYTLKYFSRQFLLCDTVKRLPRPKDMIVIRHSPEFGELLNLKTQGYLTNWRRRHELTSKLNDIEYIIYHLIEYEPNYPRCLGYITPNIISDTIWFHGGCNNCKSQQIYGIDRCKSCCYFRGDWNKPNLRVIIEHT